MIPVQRMRGKWCLAEKEIGGGNRQGGEAKGYVGKVSNRAGGATAATNLWFSIKKS